MLRVIELSRRHTTQNLNVLPGVSSIGAEVSGEGSLSGRWLCGRSTFGTWSMQARGEVAWTMLISDIGPHYDASFFLDLLQDYRCNVYSLCPIVTEREIRESVSLMHMSREHCSLVYALGAVTINLTKTDPTHDPNVSKQTFYLSLRSTELRGASLLSGEVTIRLIMVSLFLHNCLMTLRKFDMAFFYLQEAITMMLMLRMDDAAAVSKLDVQERARRQRLYWAAFIHERVLAVVDHRQVMLPPLGSDTPEFDPSLPPGAHEGFAKIVKLFSLMDDEFLRNWLFLASSTASTAVTTAWIERKHRKLEDKGSASLMPLPSSCSIACLGDMAQAALIVTRYWLRTLL